MTTGWSGDPERRMKYQEMFSSLIFYGNVAELANAPDLKSVNP